MSELVSLENERREKLFIEEEARAELFQRVGHNRNFRLKWFRLQNIETPLNR